MSAGWIGDRAGAGRRSRPAPERRNHVWASIARARCIAIVVAAVIVVGAVVWLVVSRRARKETLDDA